MKTALVFGAGGFIGNHLVKRLKGEGYYVRGVDLKYPEFDNTEADEFLKLDLRLIRNVESALKLEWIAGHPQPHSQNVTAFVDKKGFDEVYQLAADMGGAGYIFSGDNDANVMHNSALINLHLAGLAQKFQVGKIFYSSSACMYPAYNQEDPDNPKCSEDSAYPAAPDSEYGWEKLFSERLFLAYNRNYNLNVRIARFHNIYGPGSAYQGGKEKAPAALCRKVIESDNEIEIWGDGKQTRSFLYIDDCIDAVRLLMQSDFSGPVNIGSEEMISINDFARMIMMISGKTLDIKNIPGPEGVRGRNSDNRLVEQKLGWQPKYSLTEGIGKTYNWINKQIHAN
jgi:GDP-D-mannose 3', 5'-epimerase